MTPRDTLASIQAYVWSEPIVPAEVRDHISEAITEALAEAFATDHPDARAGLLELTALFQKGRIVDWSLQPQVDGFLVTIERRDVHDLTQHDHHFGLTIESAVDKAVAALSATSEGER